MSCLVRMNLFHGALVLVVIAVFDLKNAWGSLRYNQSPGSMKPQSNPVSRGPALSSQAFWNPLQKASPFQSHDSRRICTRASWSSGEAGATGSSQAFGLEISHRSRGAERGVGGLPVEATCDSQ